MDIRGYQHIVAEWLHTYLKNPGEARGFRFTEEALELAQAVGVTREEALQLVDYVYGRPVGETAQEVGGVMITLAGLCTAKSVDMEDAAMVELHRVHSPAVIAKIRAKEHDKPGRHALPKEAQ